MPSSSSEASVSEVIQFVWGLRSVDDLVVRTRVIADRSDIVQYRFALNDLWNVVAITEIGGLVQERYAYTAFGTTQFMDASFVAVSGSANEWETTFCSYRLDNETGFYQVRYRYLHPDLGRWLSRDPLGESGGANLYAYAANSPTSYVDNSGLGVVTTILNWLKNICALFHKGPDHPANPGVGPSDVANAGEATLKVGYTAACIATTTNYQNCMMNHCTDEDMGSSACAGAEAQKEKLCDAACAVDQTPGWTP